MPQIQVLKEFGSKQAAMGWGNVKDYRGEVYYRSVETRTTSVGKEMLGFFGKQHE